MEERNLRKTRVGIVVSDKMDKTITVAIQDNVRHPLYNKIVKKTYKLKAHDEENVCRVRIICVTFSEDKNENYMQCLNLVTKIETSLLEDVVVDKHYSCQMPIETIIYDENMELYQVGELMTIWELPQIHRDVRKYLE